MSAAATDHAGIIPSLSLLCCPTCRGQVRKDASSITCAECGSSYPIIDGILDFRTPEDATAGFSAAADREKATRLLRVFATSDYFELFEHYRTLDRPQDDPHSDSEYLAGRRERYSSKLKKYHLVHGDAALVRVEAHLKDLGRPPLKRGVVLEDGAGLGQFIDGFAREFQTTLVVDLSLCYLVLAKKIIEEQTLANVTLICANVERLPVRETAVDLVHFDNMVEHVARPDLAFREGRRVLAPGGVFYATSPNRFSLAVEPHFGLPAYGFIPPPIRRAIVRRRQHRDTSEVQLRSLREIKRFAQDSFGKDAVVTFLPRSIDRVTISSRARRLVMAGLRSKTTGAAFDFVLNRALLPVAPYHSVLGFG